MTGSSAISSRTAARAGSPGNAGSFSSTDPGAEQRVGRFGLRGRSSRPDPRINAYRRDIADVALAGEIIASHYAAPLLRACGAHAAFVLPEPVAGVAAVSELLPGEGFAVLEYTGPWAWGYCLADHRVGFVEAMSLVAPASATHIVCEAQVPVFADGTIGAARLACMPMGARLTGHEHGACLATDMGCVPMSHVRRLGEHESDAAGVATKLKGAPYLPGGRSHSGVDAAGLIQLALAQCGVCVPRELDLQTEAGFEVPTGTPLKRDDVVIAGDEGGIMVDDLLLLHASRAAGKVVVEPVAVVTGRHHGCVRRRVEV